MIGKEEAALWRQAEESSGALDVYLDWLLIHDPPRGELLARRIKGVALDSKDQERERRAWLAALGLDGVGSFVGFTLLPAFVCVPAEQLEVMGPVLDELPLLEVRIEFTTPETVASVFAFPTMARIRALSYLTQGYENINYQADPYYQFGSHVLEELCKSPNTHRLEVLRIVEESGSGAGTLIANTPFVALRELHITFDSLWSGEQGVVALATSPVIETLRRLSLVNSQLGDAAARTLALSAKLEQLSIDGHKMRPSAAAALRAMPSLETCTIVPDTRSPFDSLAAFEAHCGEPTLPREECPICRALPDHCYRSHASSMVADYDIDYGGEGRHDDVPAQVEQLEPFIEVSREDIHENLGGWRDGSVLRCPTCHRLYLLTKTFEMIGAANYSASHYDRHAAAALYRTRWGVTRRLADLELDELSEAKFEHHQLVRLRESPTWYSLDDANRLVALSDGHR